MLIEIPIKRQDDKVVHSEILMGLPTELKTLKSQQQHIDRLLKPIKANTISGDQPSKVAVLGETQESVDSLFSCKAVTELTQSSCLEIFHLTDLHWYNNFDMMLRVKVAASAKIVE